MSKQTPQPETTQVETKRLAELVALASSMASDLHDFGSENADYYQTQVENWVPN